MAEQTCATCEFGDGDRCYWPYHADSDGNGGPDALVDPMPPWAERQIEGNGGERVYKADCQRCFVFEVRAPEPAEADPNARCTQTADMFANSPTPPIAPEGSPSTKDEGAQDHD